MADDSIIDETGGRIADALRSLRGARAWSLSDLAARSGVSKAAISKIEREEVSPTAVILVRLAGAFDLTLAGLLVRAERCDGRRLTRAADQATWRDPETGYRRRQVFSRPDHPVELVEVELPPGRHVALPASSYARIRQVVWLRKGLLTIVEGGQRHALEPGDVLELGPPDDVAFANETADPCTYVVALARS